MAREKERKCSFCGRTDSEVSLLITGLNGYICNECAEQAYEIAKEALGKHMEQAGPNDLNLEKKQHIKNR